MKLIDGDFISAHLRSALRQIASGKMRLAQFNVEQAASLLRAKVGPVPTESEDIMRMIRHERGWPDEHHV